MRTICIIAVVMLVMTCLGVQAIDWQDNFKTASEQAKKSEKYMLLDFTGSDWCRWCVKLDKEVFSQKEFQKYAEDNLVLLVLDFPRRKKLTESVQKQNIDLMRKYKIEGYPTIVILSPEGETVGVTGYRAGGSAAYVKHLAEIIDNHKARNAKADKSK